MLAEFEMAYGMGIKHHPFDVRVTLPYACYRLSVNNQGKVCGAPPIAMWMVGKKWDTCQSWLRRKDARMELLSGQ